MKVAYFDCTSGISGNMALGAFLDAGARLSTLRQTVDALGLGSAAEVRADQRAKGDRLATHVEVVVLRPTDWQSVGAIEQVIRSANLDEGVRERALLAFRLLAGAEASAHDVAIDRVRLHEAGAIDAVIDVVGTFALAHELGIEAFFCSPLPLCQGVTLSDHGEIPLPAPATVNILQAIGAPTYHRDGDAELVTPTGAAIVGACASFEDPAIDAQREGFGAGTADLEWPNVLRVVVGELEAAAQQRPADLGEEMVSVLETNIDDMAPNLLGELPQVMLEAGALESFVTPVVMKKGRAAHLVTVVCEPALAHTLAARLIRETSTLGVRVRDQRRLIAGRRIERMESSLGAVDVKLKIVDGRIVDASPEYEDVRALATSAGIPLPDAHRRVATEARTRFVDS